MVLEAVCLGARLALTSCSEGGRCECYNVYQKLFIFLIYTDFKELLTVTITDYYYYYLLFVGRTVCKLGLLQRRCSNQKGYEKEIWL